MSKYDDPALEFERGYNFGKREAYMEIFKEKGVKYKTEFQTDMVIIAIPREVYQSLKAKAEATA